MEQRPDLTSNELKDKIVEKLLEEPQTRERLLLSEIKTFPIWRLLLYTFIIIPTLLSFFIIYENRKEILSVFMQTFLISKQPNKVVNLNIVEGKKIIDLLKKDIKNEEVKISIWMYDNTTIPSLIARQICPNDESLPPRDFTNEENYNIFYEHLNHRWYNSNGIIMCPIWVDGYLWGYIQIEADQSILNNIPEGPVRLAAYKIGVLVKPTN